MPQKPRRKRGVILSPQGKQKLLGAIREFEHDHNFGEKYTIEELSGKTGLDPGTVAKVLDAEEGADRRTLDRFFRSFDLELTDADYRRPPSAQTSQAAEKAIEVVQSSEPKVQHRVDWGEAVNVSIFYGRAEELATLKQWIVDDRCRLVTLLGMGGIGKTSLAAKLGEQIQGEFEVVVWRSLRNAPLVEDILRSLIQILSNHQAVDLPKTLDGLLSSLMRYLNQYRCLLILDNAESILRGGERAGQYRDGFEGYGELFRRIGESSHQSCLILTSREKPKEISLLEGKTRPVRSRQLQGLDPSNAQKILQAEGTSGSEAEQQQLLSRYAGNPLSVRIAATTIQELFSGNISSFLEQGTAVFGDIRDLLDQQFDRLTELGKATMYWLAINREPVSLAELREDFFPPVLPQKLLEILESLERRSLIEKGTAGFTLQNVVMEYVTERLIEFIIEEFRTRNFRLLNSHALLKAIAKDYIRETQVRLILKPIIAQLHNVTNQSKKWLETVRNSSHTFSGYITGNLLNLFCYLHIDVNNYDFSHLTVRQAYLRDMPLHWANFRESNILHSVFAEILSGILSIDFSPNGQILATGDTDYNIHLWNLTTGEQQLSWQGHNDWIRAVCFSPDGTLLATGSEDLTIRLWEPNTGQCLKTLGGHTSWIRDLAFSPDGKQLASASEDRKVRIWDVSTGECIMVLQGHTRAVRAVAFGSGNQTLASGSIDRTIRVWNVTTGECLQILDKHNRGVRSVAFSPNSSLLATGSSDHTIKLWDTETWSCLKTLSGHTGWVWSVVFSPDGQTIASGSEDQTVRLWDVETGQCLKTLYGHTSWVRAVSFGLDDKILASGSDDHTIRIWNVQGQCLRTLQGCSRGVQSVTFNPNNRLLASGGEDRTIRLWNVATGQCLQTLFGHTNRIWSVAFSPDGRMLASGSEDRSSRLWDVAAGQFLKALHGHTDGVRSVVFSPDGRILATGSGDYTIKLWEVSTGQLLGTLRGHTDWVWSVAFSPDGTKLASGSGDLTLRLWDVRKQKCLKVMQGHTHWIRSVAFSPDGQILASSSVGRTVRFWDVQTGIELRTLTNYTKGIRTVAFSPDSRILASSSDDWIIRLWNVMTGECLQTFSGHKRRVQSVTFSPDGMLLASGSIDETIRHR